MNLSDPYRKTFTDVLPHAHQVADPFYVIRLVNSTIDDKRRRLQHRDHWRQRHQGRPPPSDAWAVAQGR